MDSITIIIPVYNRKELVGATLATIPETYSIIIVDNGSTDGSYEFCRQWKLNSRRRNVIVEREFKRGAAAARNKGLSLCKTKWVYFFDSDDKFTGLPESWDEDSDMVCIPTLQERNGKAEVRDYVPKAHPYIQILNSMLNTISVIYNTDWLRSLGGWNENCLVWDDLELGTRALLNSPKLEWKTDRAYHRVLIHDESITGNSFSQRYKQEIDTLRIIFDDICDSGNMFERKKALFALFLRSYIFSGQLLREGNIQASNEVEEFIYDKFRVNVQSHRLGRLFRWFTSRGGRGAWKVALYIVGRSKGEM